MKLEPGTSTQILHIKLHCASVDDAIRILLPGALMAKYDVKTAYRNIAIHPENRYLFGMWCRNPYYSTSASPSPLSFALPNRIASAVEWILHNNYDERIFLYHLDDFLTMTPAGSPGCVTKYLPGSRIYSSLGRLHSSQTNASVQRLALNFFAWSLIPSPGYIRLNAHHASTMGV